MKEQITRRTLLAGAGAATGAAAIASLASGAAAQNSGGGFDGSAGSQLRPQVLPPPLSPDLSYIVLDPTAFHPIQSISGRNISVTGGATLATPPGGLMAPLELPLGSVLKEVVVAYASAAAGLNFAVWKQPLGGIYAGIPPFPPPGPGAPLAGGAGILDQSFTVNETIDGTASYMVLLNSIAAANQSIHGVVLGYEPPPAPPEPPAFVPISPIDRVLDTRSAGGKLQPGEERTVPLGVPALASAAIVNLTITETEGAGFVAMFPANVTWPGNSSINWSSPGQNVANGVVTEVDPTGAVKIRGGVNPTHVVIDVQGYLL